MATVKISKSKDYSFNLTKKSKDTTYVFKNADVLAGTTLNFTADGYDHLYFTRRGNDLVLCAEYGITLKTATISDIKVHIPVWLA